MEINMTQSEESKFHITPHLPTYLAARAFIKTIIGVPYFQYTHMWDSIIAQVGTPQENIDWTNPDEWIPQRLVGDDAALAWKIWRETKGIVNPRHARGPWYFDFKHNLIARDNMDNMSITPRGKIFLEQPDGEETIKIDRVEGLLNILQLVSEHSPGKRSDILPAFKEFCNTYTNYRGESVQKMALYNRMVNLGERGLIEKLGGLFFQITEKGSQYLQNVSQMILGRVINTKQVELNKLARSITREAREELKYFLSHMDPYKFEHLIGVLLGEMSYDNIQVTSPSNDKGVDVVADIELGISSVHEVIQVKRHAGSLNRQIVDLLRGSLHRFKAIRGTIITTGTFSSGAKNAAFEQNAAPITLIDGNKLLELLMEHEIGISKQPVIFYEFDNSKLQQFEEEQESLESEDPVNKEHQ